MRRLLLFYLLISFAFSAFTQDQFPQDWTGKWAGDLNIYNSKEKTQTVPMELHLLPTDFVHIYDWILMYKVPDKEEDIRNYKLIVTDSSYVIDEQNSIFLDGYLMGGVFIERFAAMNTLLTVTLEKRGNELHYRIFSGQEEAVRESGGKEIDGQEVPIVKSLPIGTYHHAILHLKNKATVED